MGKLPTVNFDEYSDEDRKLHALTARRAGRPKVGQGVNRIR
jgi:hypothetical protein